MTATDKQSVNLQAISEETIERKLCDVAIAEDIEKSTKRNKKKSHKKKEENVEQVANGVKQTIPPSVPISELYPEGLYYR